MTALGRKHEIGRFGLIVRTRRQETFPQRAMADAVGPLSNIHSFVRP